MPPYEKPKISYQMLAADSGYLSDLVETAHRSNAAAARQLESSSTSDRTALVALGFPYFRISSISRELIMSTFDDTQWDIAATGAKLAFINKQCRLLAKRIKKPTRFPIVPLPSTLNRARTRAKLRQQRLGCAEFVDSQVTSGTHRVEESEGVDGCGRTREASRIIGGPEATMRQREGVCGKEQKKGGLKRKRSQK